jgi:glucokinase
VGVFPGTGIGGGCVYEGRIVRGKPGSCFELGHVPVIRNGPLCGCGRRGCLESVASRLAIASAASAAAYRGEAPYLLSQVGTSVADIRSGVLAASVEAGDKAVREIIEEAGFWIGFALAGVVNLMAPDVVLLGGGLVEAMPNLFADAVEKSLRKQVMPSFGKSYRVAVSELGDDAGVLGAAAWAQAVAARDGAS